MLSAWDHPSCLHYLEDVPAQTKDGTRIALDINAGLVADMQQMEETVLTVSAYILTETPLLTADFPDVIGQAKIYKRVIDAAAGQAGNFRTPDIGGIRTVIKYLSTEENPGNGLARHPRRARPTHAYA